MDIDENRHIFIPTNINTISLNVYEKLFGKPHTIPSLLLLYIYCCNNNTNDELNNINIDEYDIMYHIISKLCSLLFSDSDEPNNNISKITRNESNIICDSFIY